METSSLLNRALLLSVPLVAVLINYYVAIVWYPSKMAEGNYRPYLRSPLARHLYDRITIDQEVRDQDKRKWYAVDLNKLPEHLKQTFVQFECDEDTQEFLDRCYDKSDDLFSQLWKSIAKSFLGWFMTQTSINGFLGMGSMFVFSTSQFRQFCGLDANSKFEKLLDIGAGDGAVTEMMASHFEHVHTTEVSPTMQKILLNKGYLVKDAERWHEEDQYDMISVLNVLDRCARPLTMMQQIKDSLKPSGKVIMAVVLPFKVYVEVGGGLKNDPLEEVKVEGRSWENQLNSLIEDVLSPAGFNVIAWTRLPYLCEGGLQQAFYWLSDSLLLLEPSNAV